VVRGGTLRALTVFVVLVGCSTEEPEQTLVAMDNSQLLLRASLDLRGERPSAEEYARLDANEDALEGMLDDFVQHEGFGPRVEAMFAPRIGTRVDFFGIDATDFGLMADQAASFQRSVGDEPLRILSEVATQDLPWTEVVTADWTMANEITGPIWPTDYPEAGSGWQRVGWTDGRPAAGVLASNSLWWRYPSDGVNYNRGRANAVSRIFLCENYLERDVAFPRDIDLTDQALVDDAIRNNDGCANCHVSLDALGSYLFGFQYVDSEEATDIAVYHPERERMWESTTGVEPAFFGEPGFTLADLGQQLAGDPRFVSCAVETVYEGLLGRDATFEDTDALTAHREAFLQSGLKLRALVRSVVDDERYRAAVSEGGGVSRKLVSPALMASQIEALTGFRFTVQGFDMMQTDLVGLRTLAGGADGYTVSRAAQQPTPTMLLVQERLAQGAAYALLARESDGERVVFSEGIPADPVAQRDAFVAQIQRLHLLLYGRRVPADGSEVESNLALWSDLAATGVEPAVAWADLVSALLRDPDLLLY
jgi:hypothetical protein